MILACFLKLFSNFVDGHRHYHCSYRNQTASYLTNSFLNCMTDVAQFLPINTRSCLFTTHHFMAQNDKWNAKMRLDTSSLLVPENPLIVEIGGNTDGFDSQAFRKLFPSSILNIIEPVPDFYYNLQKVFQDFKDTNLYMLGMGAFARNITIPRDSFRGQGTFIMDPTSTTSEDFDYVVLKLVDASDQIHQILRNVNYKNYSSKQFELIDILHVNCEGCEWEMFPRLLETGALSYVRYIQVSFHNYGKKGIGSLLPKYCLIREGFEKTHKRIEAVPFGWERWEIKSSLLTDTMKVPRVKDTHEK